MRVLFMTYSSHPSNSGDFMRKCLVGAVVLFVLTSCSSAPSEDASSEPSASVRAEAEATAEPSASSKPTPSKKDVYLKQVRANIPGAAAYDDDGLLNMANNVCSLGSVDLGVRVLDNYSQIEAEDREELASIALATAC
jgi:hypothetical protein